VVVAAELRYSGGVHSVPPFLWAGSRGTSAPPAGPLSVVMVAKRPQPGLFRVRAAARQGSAPDRCPGHSGERTEAMMA
jgi:hypothetical protein